MPPRTVTPRMLRRAAELRRVPSEAEQKLWLRLRAHRLQDAHFRRQHAIGPYITDFCAPRKKLIIEVDGSHHLEQEQYDADRTAFLEANGYRVLRFWNNEVLGNIDAVLEVIWEALEASS